MVPRSRTWRLNTYFVESPGIIGHVEKHAHEFFSINESSASMGLV